MRGHVADIFAQVGFGQPRIIHDVIGKGKEDLKQIPLWLIGPALKDVTGDQLPNLTFGGKEV